MERKLWTYTSPNNTKAQLGYIRINKKWINSILNGEVYTFFEGVSQNHLSKDMTEFTHKQEVDSVLNGEVYSLFEGVSQNHLSKDMPKFTKK